MKLLYFFLFLWVIFAFLIWIRIGIQSTDLIESGSETLVTGKAVELLILFISDDMFCLCLGCWTNRRTECSSRHKRANRRCPRFVFRTFCPLVGTVSCYCRYLKPNEVFVA
jgi:hypothetical protein